MESLKMLQIYFPKNPRLLGSLNIFLKVPLKDILKKSEFGGAKGIRKHILQKSTSFGSDWTSKKTFGIFLKKQIF